MELLATGIIGTCIILWASSHAYKRREQSDEMCCMMNGMIFGMVAGFFAGTLYALATNHFLYASIAGSIMGLMAGIVVGNFGGPLSRMEGVMAGPMGGLMGAMFGQMAAFYNQKGVLIFLVALVALLMLEARKMMKVLAKKSAAKECCK